MGRPKKVVTTPTEPVVEMPKKAKKVSAPNKETGLRKQIKDLTTENAELKVKLEQSEAYIKSLTEQKQNLENAVNGLQLKYSRITEYIKRSLSVFHQSVLLAFEEEVK